MNCKTSPAWVEMFLGKIPKDEGYYLYIPKDQFFEKDFEPILMHVIHIPSGFRYGMEFNGYLAEAATRKSIDRYDGYWSNRLGFSYNE